MSEIRLKIFKFFFPEEFEELERMKKTVKSLNEKIIKLKIEARDNSAKLSRCTGEINRLKMAYGIYNKENK